MSEWFDLIDLVMKLWLIVDNLLLEVFELSMADRNPSPPRDVDEACKVFITNIAGNQPEVAVQDYLRKLF